MNIFIQRLDEEKGEWINLLEFPKESDIDYGPNIFVCLYEFFTFKFRDTDRKEQELVIKAVKKAKEIWTEEGQKSNIRVLDYFRGSEIYTCDVYWQNGKWIRYFN